MKKTTKSMLISALILVCFGLLLALGSALFVKIKGIDPFGVPEVTKLSENKTLTLSEILADSPESNYMKKLSKKEYLRVAVTTFAGDVEIRFVSGESYVELVDANTSNLRIEVIGETLTVEEIDSVGIMGIFLDKDGLSFKGLRQLFGHGNSASTNQKIRIYLSDAIAVDQINVSSTVGDLGIYDVKTEKLNVNKSFGNTTVDTMVGGRLDLKGSFGNVTVKNLQNVATSVAIRFGNIKADINSESGVSSTVLENWIGDIDVNTKEATSLYKLTLSTIIGCVLRNGTEVEKSYSDSSSTTNRVTASAVLGNVSISYAGGDESAYVPPKISTEDKTTEEDLLPSTEEIFSAS